MIYNRTLEDVENAREIIETKVKKFLELTEEELDILNRGYVSVNTINRIENQQTMLKNLFNSMGYYNSHNENKEWGYSDIFKQIDLDRIVENTVLLRKAFFTFSYTPENPNAKYYFEDFNRMEKILFDLEDMANEIKSLYLECGTFECGEVNNQ